VKKQPEVITVREFADMFRINHMLAYRLCRENRIPHIRLGHRIVISRAVADRMLREGTLEAARSVA